MRIVDTTDGLNALVAELAGTPYLALDTEFMRDQTYWPKLCLIQVAAPGTEAIIDPLAEGIDLSPFYELMKQPGIVKVLHAARQDIEIFFHQGHVIPEPLFDSQIAAMVAGCAARSLMSRSTSRPASPTGADVRSARNSSTMRSATSRICAQSMST